MALVDETVKTQNDIIDIELPELRKKRFRIDGDNDRILELNTSDIGIINRLNSVYPKLIKLSNDVVSELDFSDDVPVDELLDREATKFTEIDNRMRELVDEIFQSNVSEVCVPEGTMYDPINGEFRFEHIIKTIGGLYETNFNKEFQNIARRVSKTNPTVKKYFK